MSWRKRLVQTKFMPRNEQGNMWIFMNKMVFAAVLVAVAHNGKIYYFVADRDTPKFRYRAQAQAAKLYLRSKILGKDLAIALGYVNPRKALNKYKKQGVTIRDSLIRKHFDKWRQNQKVVKHPPLNLIPLRQMALNRDDNPCIKE